MKKDRLSALLRQVRLDANLTQSQLADRIAQTQSYVSKYENGEQRLDLIELEAVCEAVGIRLTKFVEWYLEGRSQIHVPAKRVLGQRSHD